MISTVPRYKKVPTERLITEAPTNGLAVSNAYPKRAPNGVAQAKMLKQITAYNFGIFFFVQFTPRTSASAHLCMHMATVRAI